MAAAMVAIGWPPAAHAQPSPPAPRAAAALRLLELEGPEATWIAIGVIEALRDEAALATLLTGALADGSGELESALVTALTRWPARPELALPFAVELLARRPGDSELCDVFAALRGAATPSAVEVMTKLRRPPSVDPKRWLECTGVWTLSDFEGLAQSVPRGTAARAFRRPLVAAPLRETAARTALSWLTAPGATLEARRNALDWLSELKIATPEILAAVDTALENAPLRTHAAAAMTAVLTAAPVSLTLPEPRLLALHRAADLGPLAPQLAARSAKIAQELAQSFEGKRACELAGVLAELQPLPGPIEQWLSRELGAPDAVRRQCAILQGSKAVVHTPSLGPALIPLLPTVTETLGYSDILIGLIDGGAGAQLIEQLTAHLRASSYSDPELAMALFRHPLPSEANARLRHALLAPDPTRTSLPPYLQVLVALGPLSRDDALEVLERSYDHRAAAAGELRAWAFLVTGGDEAAYLAAHLRSDALPTLPAPLAPVARQLELALQILSATAGPRVTSASLRLLKHHVDNAPWTAADRPRLRALLDEPALASPAAGPLRLAISAKLAALSPEPPLVARAARYVVGLVGAHFLIWLTLLWFVYPRSRLCQSLMLHNPWARKLTGLWYTQALVRALPRLRRRMFQPLLEGAPGRRELGPDAGFNDKIQLCPVLPGETAQAPQRLGEAVPWTALLDQAGVLVIEGESGVGKSQVLRALLARARAQHRTCLLLRAAECAGGVTRSIERALELGHADGFVDSLLHGGAVELFLDGLNEAPPATVAEITSFCNRARHARVYLTSQPMRWAYPADAPVWRLLPLAPEQLREFLLSQWDAVQHQELAKPTYEARVEAFLSERPFAERDVREQEVLRNRYDLAFVAYLLTRDLSPNLHSLRQQVVEDVARTYAETVPGGVFPLAALGALAVQVLENGAPMLELDGLDAVVVELLVERKLVLRRGDGTCIFRHDSITSYFAAEGVFAPLVTAERLDERAVARERLANQRFRGVYLQLAESRPLAAVERLALALREFQREHDALTELDREVQAILDRRQREQP